MMDGYWQVKRVISNAGSLSTVIGFSEITDLVRYSFYFTVHFPNDH